MDRRIAFRAWDGKEFLPLAREVAFIDDDGVLRSRIEGIIFNEFTGLHDKQGKEIYEGDIIEYLDNTSQGLVKKTVTITDIRSLPDFGCSKWEEIIGNIYKNGELLEAQ